MKFVPGAASAVQMRDLEMCAARVRRTDARILVRSSYGRAPGIH